MTSEAKVRQTLAANVTVLWRARKRGDAERVEKARRKIREAKTALTKIESSHDHDRNATY
jgi:hypothetical protein